MKRILLAVGLLGLWLGVTGCYKMTLDATALEPAVVIGSDAPGQSEAIAEFETDTRASWLLWGLVDLGEPDIGDAILREVRREGGTAATGVEVKTQTTFLDGLVSALTFGIYAQRTTFVTGTVVR